MEILKDDGEEASIAAGTGFARDSAARVRAVNVYFMMLVLFFFFG